MNGLIILNKPTGLTSHDVVIKVRELLNIKKVGHTGTLDPMASGVLLTCVGKATKIIQFLINERKKYYAEMTLGITTDTGDREGQIISKKKVKSDENEIVNALKKFKGRIKQRAPSFSAIKLKGVPLYKRKRRGEEVEPPLRDVEIFDLKMMKIRKDKNDVVCFEVECSKGTYIRSLCTEIGEELGVGAHLSKLVRLKNGKYNLEDSITLEELAKSIHHGKLEEIIISLEKALEDFKSVRIFPLYLKAISHGSPLKNSMIKQLPEPILPDEIMTILDENGSILAIHRRVKRYKESQTFSLPEVVF